MSGRPADATYAAFAARLRAEGFEVSDATTREMWAALPNLDALRQRVRRNHDRADEPAHVFHPARQGEPKGSPS